jgi:hypothetical protein
MTSTGDLRLTISPYSRIWIWIRINIRIRIWWVGTIIRHEGTNVVWVNAVRINISCGEIRLS